MPEAEPPLTSRNFSRADAKRGLILAAIIAVVGVCYWLVLPAVQSQIVPKAPGGSTGPWVLRPIWAFRFGAVAIMSCVTIAVIARPLKRKWQREDVALGTRYDPFNDTPARRIVIAVQACLLLLLYASALAFYLFSWETVGPNGIEQRLPWGRLNHPFQAIRTLEMIPEGERSDSIKESGPWYCITLHNDRSIIFSLDNEGTTSDELRHISAFVAERTGVAWVQRTDTRSLEAP